MAETPKLPKRVPSGTMAERMGEAKNRPYKGTKGGLPERQGRYRGKLSRGGFDKPIRMSQASKGSVAASKFKAVPLGEKPKLLSGPKPPVKEGIGGRVAKGLFRGIGGPAIMLASMNTPAGEGSDRPVQSLRKKYKDPIGPRRPEAKSPDSGKKVDLETRAERPVAKPKAKPERKTEKKEISAEKKAEFKAKMQGRRPEGRKTFRKEVPFRGNWVGAAPTEMQKRGGARIRRSNLLSRLRGD